MKYLSLLASITAAIALSGCAGGAYQATANNPALGQSGSSLGIGNMGSSNGVQLYGTVDAGIGYTSTRTGGSTSSSTSYGLR